MDFIFNIGEHYYQGDESSFLKDFLTTFLGSLLGFGSALLIYYFETSRDNKKEEKNKSDENRNKLIYLKQLIESVVKTYEEQQLPFLKEFIAFQKTNLLELKAMKQVASNDFARLKSIDNKGIFEAWNEFFNNGEDSIKEFNNTISSIDFLEESILETYRIERENNERCYKILLEVKDYFEDIPTILSSFARQSAVQLGDSRWNNDYYNFIDLSIKNYIRIIKNKPNLEAINAEFLTPLLVNYYEKFDGNDFPEEILKKAKKARVKMNDVKMSVEQTLHQFEMVEERNVKALSFLKQTIIKLNNLPIQEFPEQTILSKFLKF